MVINKFGIGKCCCGPVVAGSDLPKIECVVPVCTGPGWRDAFYVDTCPSKGAGPRNAIWQMDLYPRRCHGLGVPLPPACNSSDDPVAGEPYRYASFRYKGQPATVPDYRSTYILTASEYAFNSRVELYRPRSDDGITITATAERITPVGFRPFDEGRLLMTRWRMETPGWSMELRYNPQPDTLYDFYGVRENDDTCYWFPSPLEAQGIGLICVVPATSSDPPPEPWSCAPTGPGDPHVWPRWVARALPTKGGWKRARIIWTGPARTKSDCALTGSSQICCDELLPAGVDVVVGRREMESGAAGPGAGGPIPSHWDGWLLAQSVETDIDHTYELSYKYLTHASGPGDHTGYGHKRDVPGHGDNCLSKQLTHCNEILDPPPAHPSPPFRGWQWITASGFSGAWDCCQTKLPASDCLSNASLMPQVDLATTAAVYRVNPDGSYSFGYSVSGPGSGDSAGCWYLTCTSDGGHENDDKVCSGEMSDGFALPMTKWKNAFAPLPSTGWIRRLCVSPCNSNQAADTCITDASIVVTGW